MRIIISCLALLGGFMTTSVQAETHEKATFAGGCFWCMQGSYDYEDGVIKTVVGYANGNTENPTYEEVSKGGTGHVEAMQITYDPNKISYQKLLDIFWQNHDPLDDDGQFCDRGDTYRPAIIFHNEEQKKVAEESKTKLQAEDAFGGKILTSIEPMKVFYAAEDYHQDYYIKNQMKYKFYRYRCGRDERLEELKGSN